MQKSHQLLQTTALKSSCHPCAHLTTAQQPMSPAALDHCLCCRRHNSKHLNGIKGAAYVVQHNQHQLLVSLHHKRCPLNATQALLRAKSFKARCFQPVSTLRFQLPLLLLLLLVLLLCLSP